MLKYFGLASAQLIDTMSEDECVPNCRAKITGFIREDAAKELDNL